MPRGPGAGSATVARERESQSRMLIGERDERPRRGSRSPDELVLVFAPELLAGADADLEHPRHVGMAPIEDVGPALLVDLELDRPEREPVLRVDAVFELAPEPAQL